MNGSYEFTDTGSDGSSIFGTYGSFEATTGAASLLLTGVIAH